MSCEICKKFLSDFLETGTHRDLQLSKKIRTKSIHRVLPELTDWMYRMYKRIPKNEFDKATLTSSNIARRGRPLLEYECILHTATFNFLKFRLPWLTSEVDYISTLLLENSFIQSSKTSGGILYAYDYIAYTTPRVILQLTNIHQEHEVLLSKSVFIEQKNEEDDLYF